MIVSAAASGTVLATQNNAQIDDISLLPELEPSGVIRVNSDADLASLSDSGSGTLADPYVIENKRIDATGQGAGIYVRNTTKALIIRNCWVSNSTDLDPNWGPGANIMVYSDGPCVIENNRCDNSSSEGIKAMLTNSRLSNNTIWGTQNGINLVSGTDCTVENNTVTGLTWTGIAVIMVSEFNTVSNNTITNCPRGISLYAQGNENLVRDNRITGCNVGIYAEVGNNNDILNNTIDAADNTQKGIEITSSTGNLIHENDIDGGQQGVFVHYADHNIILNNSITNGAHGIEISDSVGNQVIDNEMVGNSAHVFFRSSNEINVINNTFREGATGVWLYDAPCNENNIIGNLFESSSNFGVLIAPDDGGTHRNNTIVNNTFLECHFQGVYISSGGQNDTMILNNAFIGCYPGHPQASDSSSNVWNTSSSGNYWHEHTSPDSNYDRIVDDAYIIGGTGGNFDYYPLTSTLRITDPVDMSSTESPSVTLSGTLLNPYNIASFVWHNDASSETGNCSGSGSWAADVPLRSGENDITISMTDSYGYTYSDNITILSDTTIMTMDPVNGSTVYTNESSIDLSLNVSGYWPLDQASVTHFVNGTQYDFWYEGSAIGLPWFEDVWTLDLQEGVNRFEIAFRNTNGQTVMGILTAVKDTLAPMLTLTSPSESDYLASGDVLVEWTLMDATETSIAYSLDSPVKNYVTGSSVTLNGVAEGEHTLVLMATDRTNNTASRSVNFTVDVTKPYLSITSPANGTLFAVNHVLVNYTADDALTSLAYLQYRLDTGSWSDVTEDNISLTSLPDGVHAVHMRTADLAGNANTTSISFTVDTTAPVVTITAPADGGYSRDRIVTWTVNDVSGAEMTEVSTDNTNWTTITGNSRMFTLLDGTHTVYVRVTDHVGLVGTDNVTFTIDTLDPTVEVTSPGGDAYNNTGSVLVRWNAADANGIAKTEISKDGSTWSVVTGTSATVSGLTDGMWTIYVRVTDPAGNTMTDSAVVGVSMNGASVELVPNETVYTRDNSLEITADISDTAPFTSVVLRVHVNGVLISEKDLTNEVLGDKVALLSSMVTLTEGINVISLTVNDSAGNSVTAEVQVVLDTIAPTFEISYPAEGELLNHTIGIATWSASDNENGSGLNNTWAKVDNDAWMEIGSAEGWIFAVTGDGEHTLYVRIDDQAGNVVEKNVTFFVDTTSPAAEVSPIGDDLELDSIVVVEFSEAMNSTSVSVVVDGVVGNMTWNGNVLTFTPTALEYAQDYYVTVSGKDLAGNVMEMNWTFRTTSGTGSLTGMIVDEDGEPIANITVRVGDLTAVTNELGRFILNDLTPGNYVLTVDEEGYEMYSDAVTVTVGETEELGELTLVAEGSEEQDDGGSTMLLIVAAMAIIAVVGVVAVVVLKRRP